MRVIKFGGIEVCSDDSDSFDSMLRTIEKLIKMDDKEKDKIIDNLKEKLKRRKKSK